MKNFCLATSASLMTLGFGSFGVLMADVISSGNAGRATLQLSSAEVSNLALGALIFPGLAALPLAAAERAQNRAERG